MQNPVLVAIADALQELPQIRLHLKGVRMRCHKAQVLVRQIKVKPDQILRESSTTASLALQLPVVVVQQLLQILHKNCN